MRYIKVLVFVSLVIKSLSLYSYHTGFTRNLKIRSQLVPSKQLPSKEVADSKIWSLSDKKGWKSSTRFNLRAVESNTIDGNGSEVSINRSIDTSAVNVTEDFADIDFQLLKKTMDQWRRPLPNSYISQPLVIVGPSGVGKGRMIKGLLKDYAKYFKKVVTHTTRKPRSDETNGTYKRCI